MTAASTSGGAKASWAPFVAITYQAVGIKYGSRYSRTLTMLRTMDPGGCGAYKGGQQLGVDGVLLGVASVKVGGKAG
ncbi:unnamed protein product [Fusarium graminearum]|nr:unnamed protein product [Fusarium graminearum]CAG1988785.1 unnamed protein product [Fusarium graminearum]VTO81608.1 unnamed protein product [Fusarium graminearum]